MEINITGKPAFAYVNVDLQPGETIIAEGDAMASMAAGITAVAKPNGGIIGGLVKKYVGGESFFVNHFTNNTSVDQRLTLTQPTPGDMKVLELNDQSYCLEGGSYIASTPGIKLGVKWAGISSFIGGEGLFKLQVSGTGKVIFGAYGALIEKEIDGEYIVDSSHLVGYEPHMKLKTQLSGGIFSSFFGGEGLVTRVEGKGKIIIQSRSVSGLTSWLNRYF
ncbi:MAG: TIGR00266 family protein [Bacteroidetes bacterium]|nr:TIGR00266 family protein [Bacteroidota bacterium]